MPQNVKEPQQLPQRVETNFQLSQEGGGIFHDPDVEKYRALSDPTHCQLGLACFLKGCERKTAFVLIRRGRLPHAVHCLRFGIVQCACTCVYSICVCVCVGVCIHSVLKKDCAKTSSNFNQF